LGAGYPAATGAARIKAVLKAAPVSARNRPARCLFRFLSDPC